MRIKITYDTTPEKMDELLMHEDIEKVEVVLNKNSAYEGLDEAIHEWLIDHNINGYAVGYARDLFCKSTLGSKFADLSATKFAKVVRDTGAYVTKNLRICDVVRYCFVAVDGHRL